MAVLALTTSLAGILFLKKENNKQINNKSLNNIYQYMIFYIILLDMRERLGRMVIGTSRRGEAITADDLGGIFTKMFFFKKKKKQLIINQSLIINELNFVQLEEH